MTQFNFSHAVQVRYVDLDPQGHVNNAHFLSYFEQARINYMIHVGLFERGTSFLDIGIILADAHVTYLSPVMHGYVVLIQVAITKLGTKSMTMEYLMLEQSSGLKLSKCSTVLVTFDYRKQVSIPLPLAWREKITAFEKM
jgi:acyl-CoA thioester hydrolase